MGASFLDIEDAGGRRREVLNRGLTRIGGRNPEIALSGSGGEQLQVWDEPPRVVYVGSGRAPRINGAAVEEAPLVPGDRIEWAGATLVYCGPVREASLEEIALPPVPPSVGAGGASLREEEELAWRRLQAGLLVELGMADMKVARRWQDAVKQGQFDPDQCAREILAAQESTGDETRLVDRSGRLLRDLVMAPLMRGAQGAKRRAREATRSAVAALLTQVVALVVYSVIVALSLLALRVRGIGFDAVFDRVLGPLAPK